MPRRLSQIFTVVGAKRLSDVEVVPGTSNQHEFNGISDFRNIFGDDRINFQGHFIYLIDDEEAILEDTGSLTWYDARENHETRTEYRLYYSSNIVIDAAEPGDLAIIGKTDQGKLVVVVASEGSTSEQQLLWLFGLEEVGPTFIVRDLTTEDAPLNFAGQYIIDSLGFADQEVDSNYLEQILDRFGGTFPTTAVFSDYARSTLEEVSSVDDPDNAVLTWLEREELLFKTLEKHLVAERLQQGFGENGDNVDDFISFSLSVQNRRKSRAGRSFENHLAYLFGQLGISCSWGARTERNNKPDFLFPGILQYENAGYSAELLTMLGVKTSAKDRWRQVLSEAERITHKHLITLEPAISANQTDEMIAQNLQLVLPQPLIETYSVEQQEQIISLSDFITVVRERQQVA